MRSLRVGKAEVAFCSQKWLAAAACLSTALVLLGGCGESTEDAMMRAMRRSVANDEEEVAEAPAANPQNPPAPQSAADEPAAEPARQNPAAPAAARASAAASYPEAAPIDPRSLGITPVGERKPNKPLAGQAAARYEVANLRQLADTIRTYVRDEDRLPFPDIKEAQRGELLSWRVRLLPAFGYNELYTQFRFDEPWDSPHNIQLLPFIPPVFVNPERLDGHTSILAVEGPGLAYDPGLPRHDPADFQDGEENTLLLVAVAAEHAVPWTQPDDFAPLEGWSRGQLLVRGDQFVGVLADGRAVQFPASTDDAALDQAYTTSAGDGPDASLFAALAVPRSTDSAVAEAAAETEAETEPREQMPVVAERSAAEDGGLPAGPSAPRQPVPASEELEDATDVLRELYADRLKNAENPADRQRLAAEMLEEAETLVADPAGRLALLRAARMLAVGQGDFELAWQATDRIIQYFDVDRHEERAEALELEHRIVANPRMRSPNTEAFVRQCLEVIHAAVQADQYDIADEVVDFLDSATARGSKLDPATHARLRREVHRARGYYRQVSPSLLRLQQNPDDSDAAEQVGRYLCFVKGDWESGIPMLAGGRSPAAQTALQEMDASGRPQQIVDIAAAWYELGKRSDDTLTRTGALGRAAYWYAQAATGLSESLRKLEAKVRLRELENQDSNLMQTLAKLANEHGAEIDVL